MLPEWQIISKRLLNSRDLKCYLDGRDLKCYLDGRYLVDVDQQRQYEVRPHYVPEQCGITIAPLIESQTENRAHYRLAHFVHSGNYFHLFF